MFNLKWWTQFQTVYTWGLTSLKLSKGLVLEPGPKFSLLVPLIVFLSRRATLEYMIWYHCTPGSFFYQAVYVHYKPMQGFITGK